MAIEGRTRTGPLQGNLNIDGRVAKLDKVYTGFVKDNRDVTSMGRLRVYIPELGGDPTDQGNWYTVRYCAPFAGSTTVDWNVVNGSTWEQSQRSYGFWMIPPHLENEVVVMFINGSPNNGIWIGCLYQSYMTHSIPGYPTSVKTTAPGEITPAGPVVEYNKKTVGIQPPDPPRPIFTPMDEAFAKQGWKTQPLDFERGQTDAGARRETPSNIFGFVTPGGHQFYVDDGKLLPATNDINAANNTENDLRNRIDPAGQQFMRMRTRHGVQVLLHDTKGYIYMNTKNGNSWFEISDDGINIFSVKPIRMRTLSDMHLRIDQNFNIDVGGTTKWRNAGAVKETFESTHDTFVSGERKDYSGGNHSTRSGSNIFRDAARIDDNLGSAATAEQLQTKKVFDRSIEEGYPKTDNQSIIPMRDFLYHEPWDYHTVGRTLPPPGTEGQGVLKDGAIKGAAIPGAKKSADIIGSPKAGQPAGIYEGKAPDKNGNPRYEYKGEIPDGTTKTAKEWGDLDEEGQSFIKAKEGAVIRTDENGEKKHVLYDDKTGKPISNAANAQGTPTVGYGHALTAEEKKRGFIMIDGQPVDYSKGLTEAQANSLYKQDFRHAQDAVARNVSRPLTKDQYEVLVDVAYNRGPTGLTSPAKGNGQESLSTLVNQGRMSEATDVLRTNVGNSQKFPGLAVRGQERAVKFANVPKTSTTA